MVDWLIWLLLALAKPSLWDTMIGSVLAMTVGWQLIVLIHELGHAAAVLIRGLRLEMLAVGDREDVLVRIGRTVLRFGRPERGDWSGFVTIDPESSPEDVIVIALAGPLANILAAPVFAVAAHTGGTHGPVDVALWILAVLSAAMADNLIPRGALGVAPGISDGRVIQYALAIRAGRPLPEPPAAPPKPEPSEPAATEADEVTFRKPFKVVLAVAFLLLVSAGGWAGGMIGALASGLMLAVPVAVLFGIASLTGAHRWKVF